MGAIKMFNDINDKVSPLENGSNNEIDSRDIREEVNIQQGKQAELMEKNTTIKEIRGHVNLK